MEMVQQNRPSVMILGSTGSVGQQALDVARRQNFPVDAICAQRNVSLVEQQARTFGVRACAMSDEGAARDLRTRLADTAVRVYSGTEGILEMIRECQASLALNAIVGKAGLMPTIAALESEKQLALANKESLVVAGDIVMGLARRKGRTIRPVDSEHCAIAQCLTAGRKNEVKKLILTASGGPFFGKTRDQLQSMRRKDALAHPTWQMGQKITVDSATLMNKGFEIIEASYLFDVPESRIEVIVHRESIIHSMVEYIDHSIMAQLSVPDMRHCIQHALTDPCRETGVIRPLSLTECGTLTFAAPDEETFTLLRLARQCLREGGAMPAVLNAANEVAVDAFLQDRIGFCEIFDVVEEIAERLTDGKNANTLEQILQYDAEARRLTAERLGI